MNIGQSPPGLLAAGPVRPGDHRAGAVPCVAPDVGRAGGRTRRRVRRPRRAAGPRRLPFRVPEVGILLVPVALGLALAAACAVASFASDVAGGTFGWRQPLGVLSIAAVLCGMFPALVTLTDGWWFARDDDDDVGRPEVAADDFGDFRVLYLGDPRVLPPHRTTSATAWPTPSRNPASRRSLTAGWRRAPTPTTSWRRALADVSSGATQRGGRLLAPYAIRYIVVPYIDGGQSTASDPIDPPIGLTDAFGAQLDLRHLFTSPNFDVFENTPPSPAWLRSPDPWPSTSARGSAELVRRDLMAPPPRLSATPGVRVCIR